MIGRYLDALPEDARDRVLTAQEWRAGALFADTGVRRCVIGHAEYDDCCGILPWVAEFRQLHPYFYRRKLIGTGDRFDKLAGRRGLAEAVRLIKQRAGRPNRVPMPVSEKEAVHG